MARRAALPLIPPPMIRITIISWRSMPGLTPMPRRSVLLAAGADTFAGAIPTILKVNSANSLSRQKENADQAVTASVYDALRLGCAAIGFTIYPGSDAMYNQYEEFRELSREAKSKGLAVVLWSLSARRRDLQKTAN